MGDKELSDDYRYEATKNDMKTSTQIGVPNCRARTIMYEKKPLMSLPKIRTDPAHRTSGIYTPHEGFKTTYRQNYMTPFENVGFSADNSVLLRQVRPYSKLGGESKPLKFGLTEYKNEYGFKQAAPCTQGVSVEKTTTCPLVLTGRDEREPLPLTANYGKYLDIYVSTTRGDYRAFTLQEQRGLAAKDIVTSQETMDIPKGRGFGCKYPAFPGQDLDNRDKNMIDKAKFKFVHKLRYMPKGMPKVPNFGSESEIQAAYQPPSGVALPHLFDRFVEFPQEMTTPEPRQTLCPPGMYKAESSVIHNHASPQLVV